MANKKFSEFVLKTTTSDVSHIVGYNGAENVQITPANFVTSGGTGVFLPLAGGIMVGDTTHNDNVKSIYGTLGDGLEIYHNGTNSYIDDSGTGTLILRSSDLRIEKYTGEEIAKFVSDGAVSLYYDNSKKFETTTLGATVTGDLLVTGTITGVGGSYLPLAGGTLTGALTGTSATFGGDVKVTGSNSLLIRDDGTFIKEDQGLQIGNTSVTGATRPIRFFTESVERLTIDSSGNSTFAGNVGIKDNPSFALDVNIASSRARFKAATGDASIELSSISGRDYLIQSKTDGSFIIYDEDASSERLRLDSLGNLGIGTVTPNQENFGVSSLALSVKAPSSGGVANLELIGLGNAEGDEVGYVNFMSQNATDSLASIVGIRRGDDTTGKLQFRTAGTTKFTIEDDNQIRFVGDFFFASNTSNSSDVNSLNFSGGGGFGDTRGASISLAGNENGNGGLMQIRAGQGAISQIRSYTDGVERSRLQANGDLNLTTGSFKVDTAGQGIYLGGTAAGNLLDNYEEGTWTPDLSAQTAPSGVTYNFRSGSYTRIGNKVWIRMGVNIANVGTGGSGVLLLTGLPFTAANEGSYSEPTSMAIGGRWVTAANAGNVYAFVQNATNQFQFRTMAANNDTALNYSELIGGASNVGTWFTMQCFYQIA